MELCEFGLCTIISGRKVWRTKSIFPSIRNTVDMPKVPVFDTE